MAKAIKDPDAVCVLDRMRTSDNDVWQAALYLEYKREALQAGMKENEAEEYAVQMME